MSETKTGTATLLKSGLLKGNANLYRLDPPMAVEESDWDNVTDGVPETKTRNVEHVIVSAVYDDFGGTTSLVLHETYIFEADAAGKITDWSELDGSLKDTQDHAAALRAAGYEVAS